MDFTLNLMFTKQTFVLAYCNLHKVLIIAYTPRVNIWASLIAGNASRGIKRKLVLISFCDLLDSELSSSCCFILEESLWQVTDSIKASCAPRDGHVGGLCSWPDQAGWDHAQVKIPRASAWGIRHLIDAIAAELPDEFDGETRDGKIIQVTWNFCTTRLHFFPNMHFRCTVFKLGSWKIPTELYWVDPLECVATIFFLHICGATLYAWLQFSKPRRKSRIQLVLTSPNVSKLAIISDIHHSYVTLVGRLMQACRVPRVEQECIFQGYMMHNLHRGGNEAWTDCIDNGELPAAVERLPGYLQLEVSSYVQADAIKRRDAAFAYCSNEFLLSLVSALHQNTMLITGDYFVQEQDKIPQQVFLVEKGRLEVISNGKCTRTLERGDIINKWWLLQPGKESSTSDGFSRRVQPSIHAHSGCTLISGLSDPTRETFSSWMSIENVWMEYSKSSETRLSLNPVLSSSKTCWIDQWRVPTALECRLTLWSQLPISFYGCLLL